MRNNLTNLLPPERQESLAREYRFRFGVVATEIFITLVVVATVLLIPTYVFLAKNVQAKETRLANMKTTLSSSDEMALSARLVALSNDATSLISLSKRPSASSIIRSVLAVSRPGVTVSGISYTPPAGKSPSTIALNGTAATREALRRYQLALQDAPSVLSADLPVSAYAKDTNIIFTITVILAP
ncbi:MAG: hypothetical protein WAV50_03525 [Minisyncoccia bacterium]